MRDRESVASRAAPSYMRRMSDSDHGAGSGTGPKDDADVVLKGFWNKVRRTLGRVPFLDEAVAAYYCATDPKTPRRVQAILLGALAYFVVPTDMIPDFIAGLGFTDDAAVLAAVIGTVRRHITDDHRAGARAVLDRFANTGGSETTDDG